MTATFRSVVELCGWGASVARQTVFCVEGCVGQLLSLHYIFHLSPYINSSFCHHFTLGRIFCFF